jgi:hypothetical protein
MRCIIPNKVRFVNELSKAITPFKTGIKSIEYKVFKNKQYEDWYQEFLVVNYDGGASSVRNCNGNSFSAIFEELAQYLDSGYYLEVQDLQDYKIDPNWIEVNLEQLDEDYKNR